jgi:Flp pilus assembly protein TadD
MNNPTRKQQIEAMLGAEPNDLFLRYALAMEHVGAGADAEAVRCLRELLALDPNYVPAYLQAGRALARLGRDDEAREVWRAGVGVARRKGDEHAAGEMSGFLEGLEG